MGLGAAYRLTGGPVLPYGVKPVRVWLSTEYIRAAPGGTGEVKCAGNYGGSFAVQAQAVMRGCDQVVWLDALERRWVEEMGGMNLFFVYGSVPSVRVVTPPLSGSLLAGVTRDMVLTLAADLGYHAREEKISVDDWHDGSLSGQLTEVFACGTASSISPVGQVRRPPGRRGPATARNRMPFPSQRIDVPGDRGRWSL